MHIFQLAYFLSGTVASILRTNFISENPARHAIRMEGDTIYFAHILVSC